MEFCVNLQKSVSVSQKSCSIRNGSTSSGFQRSTSRSATTNRSTTKANRSAATTKTERIAIAGRPVSEVEKYADLKQQGIITEEEFQKLKMDFLSRI
jgi:hypothetical protein